MCQVSLLKLGVHAVVLHREKYWITSEWARWQPVFLKRNLHVLPLYNVIKVASYSIGNNPAFSNGWLGVVLFSRVVVSVRYILPNVLLKNESNESKSNELFIKDPSIAAILMVMVYVHHTSQ